MAFKRNGVSEDFPSYFKMKDVPVNQSRKVLNGGAKMCFPDKTAGVSQEFPTYFRNNHQLVSAYSRPNPYMEEDYVRQSIQNAKRNHIYSSLEHSASTTTGMKRYGSMLEEGFKHPQTTKGAQNPHHHKSTCSLLDQAYDQHQLERRKSLSSFDRVKPGDENFLKGEIIISSQLKGLQDFNFRDQFNMLQHLQNSKKVVEIYDCINDTRKNYMAPPRKDVERISKVRANYMKMVETQPKCFNKKLGLFNHYVNNTKTSQDCDKALKEIELEKKGLLVKRPPPKNYLDELRATRNLSLQAKEISPIKQEREVDEGVQEKAKEAERYRTLPPLGLSPKSSNGRNETLFTPKNIAQQSQRDKNINQFLQTFHSSQTGGSKFGQMKKKTSHSSLLQDENIMIKEEKKMNEEYANRDAEKELARKLRIQEKVLQSFLPARQSIESLSTAFKKYSPKYRNFEEYLRQQQWRKERVESRQKSIEDLKEVEEFEERLRRSIGPIDEVPSRARAITEEEPQPTVATGGSVPAEASKQDVKGEIQETNSNNEISPNKKLKVLSKASSVFFKQYMYSSQKRKRDESSQDLTQEAPPLIS